MRIHIGRDFLLLCPRPFGCLCIAAKFTPAWKPSGDGFHLLTAVVLRASKPGRDAEKKRVLRSSCACRRGEANSLHLCYAVPFSYGSYCCLCCTTRLLYSRMDNEAPEGLTALELTAGLHIPILHVTALRWLAAGREGTGAGMEAEMTWALESSPGCKQWTCG